MSTATKHPYQPRILQPKLRIAHHGISAFLVESHRANEFYFVWIQPSGNMRCQCTGAKYHDTCSHREALKAKLEAAPHGLSEAAFVAQQQEADRLASLPKTLAQVTESEETKLEQVAAIAEANRLRMVAEYQRMDTSSATLDALYDTDAFWQDAQAERVATLARQAEETVTARREAALERVEREESIVESVGQRQRAAAIAREEARKAVLDEAERAEKERRETAILQTDDRPFSIYKSVASRHVEDAYGERADYVPADYASHQYR